ncbi:MAG: MFS transporter [Candidatus Nitrosocaldus sp.]|nr:MFS transporter [Candidatus Nitrosocaldus sp.]MDW8275795.1 MFS transporter [Candidatus Nitrosocaldus sp.]
MRSSGHAFRLILLLGLVSLTADMVYEGARSITGPYLLILGATATTVGLVSGAGEVAAYGARILFGHIADRSGRHWMLMVSGYMMILSLPALAFVNRLDIASTLIILERLGKAVRTPARDAIIASIASSIGRGKGFGIHEAMDQIGAVIGPLIVAVLLYHRGYGDAFLCLFIPAVATCSLLLYARRRIPSNPSHMSVQISPVVSAPRTFWLYLAFVSIGVAGYAHFQLISYHVKFTSAMDDAYIPLLFAAAMGVDALVAIIAGYLFDRRGLAALLLIPLTSIPIAPLAFSLNPIYIVVGVVLWGAVMGMQETMMRAAIAGMVDGARLATAYGLFNGVYGIAWFSGSMIMGMLYDTSVAGVIVFSVALSTISLLLLLVMLGIGVKGSTR